jgi:hypothetical protein
MPTHDMFERPPAGFRPGQLHTPQLDALLARPLARPAPVREAGPILQQAPHGRCNHDLLVQCLVPHAAGDR